MTEVSTFLVSGLLLELDRNDMSVDCVGVTACILVTVTAVRTPSVGPRLSLLVICRMFWWDRLQLHHAACCCRLHPAPATTFVCVWFLASPHHRYQAHGLNLGRYTFLPPVQSNCEIKMGAVIELYNTDTQIDPCADIGGYLNGGDTEPSPSFQIDCRHQFCQRNFAKFQDHCLLNALDRLESIHHKSKVKVNHQQAALRIFAN